MGNPLPGVGVLTGRNDPVPGTCANKTSASRSLGPAAVRGRARRRPGPLDPPAHRLDPPRPPPASSAPRRDPPPAGRVPPGRARAHPGPGRAGAGLARGWVRSASGHQPYGASRPRGRSLSVCGRAAGRQRSRSRRFDGRPAAAGRTSKRARGGGARRRGTERTARPRPRQRAAPRGRGWAGNRGGGLGRASCRSCTPLPGPPSRPGRPRVAPLASRSAGRREALSPPGPPPGPPPRPERLSAPRKSRMFFLSAAFPRRWFFSKEKKKRSESGTETKRRATAPSRPGMFTADSTRVRE